MLWEGLSRAPAWVKLLLLVGGSFLASAALTPLVRRLAHRLGAVDHPDERKIHEGIVPRLGGLAIYGSFLLVGLAGVLFSPRIHRIVSGNPEDAGGFIAGSLLILAIGIYDDVWRANAPQKLTVQFLAAGVMFAAGCRIQGLDVPFLGVVSLGWASLPATLVWIALVTNAINLLDGIDGLAAGVSVVSLVTIALVGAGGHQTLPLLALVVAAATLGFLPSNFPPASIFMGDAGSLFLGFAIGVLSVYSSTKTAAATVLAPVLLLVALPLLDVVLAIFRRLFARGDGAPDGLRARLHNVVQADSKHIHHQLLEAGLSDRETVLLLCGLQLLACVLVVVILGTDLSGVTGSLVP